MADMTVRQKKLPDEILESQKTRSTLLKWKLVIVASLGAAGLGLASGSRQKTDLLSLIPFVCVYVDLLCTNINLRIMLIGQYLAKKCGDSYELFTSARRDWFVLEDWALYGSTYCVSGILGFYAVLNLVLRYTHENFTEVWGFGECLAILIACIIGPCLTLITKQAYYNKRRTLKDES